jgi:hypothetical protein
MAEGDACLLDSNILLRISKSDDPHHPVIVQALKALVGQGGRCSSGYGHARPHSPSRACAQMRPSELADQDGGRRRERHAVSEGQWWVREGYGNDGFMESVEKQKQLFPSSHAPLEISPKAGEIPTFPQPRVAPDGKVGKPQAGFPLSHAGRATTAPVSSFSELNTKARDLPLRGRVSLLRIALEGNANSNQKISCRRGYRRGTTGSVLDAVRWPVLK